MSGFAAKVFARYVVSSTYSAWVRPSSDAYLKRDFAEIRDNEGLLDDSRYSDDDLIDPAKREIDFSTFKSLVAAAPIKDISKAEATYLVTEAASGKIPPKEWLLDASKAPSKDWKDDEKWRYTKANAATLVPRFLNNEPVDMPVVFYSRGKPVFAAGGRHRLAYAVSLDLPIKVVAITEEQLAIESGLLTDEAAERLKKENPL